MTSAGGVAKTPSHLALLPIVVLCASSTLWGLTWLPLKFFGTYGIQGPLVTLVAHGSVAVCALPFLFRQRNRLRPHLRALLCLALAGGLANVAFASAMVVGDVTRVMALFYLLPAWGVLGGKLLLGERVDRQRRGSLFCALLGAFLVLGGPHVFDAPPGIVDLVALVSGMALALNNILFRRLSAVAVPTKVACTFVGGLCWASALSLFRPLPTSVPPDIWAMVVGFGLIWILLATLGTLWSVNQMEAGRSSVLIIMELVTAVVSAAVVTGKLPTRGEAAGGFLILLSAVVEASRTRVAVGVTAAGGACEEG